MLNFEEGVNLIRFAINHKIPTRIGKLGANECWAINVACYGVPFTNQFKVSMENNAGVYPLNTQNDLNEFVRVLTTEFSKFDIVSPWNHGKNRNEEAIYEALKMNVSKKDHVPLPCLDPFSFTWEDALVGKKVAIVTPFKDTVLKQYENRKILGIPEFSALTVIQSRYSPVLHPNKTEYVSWKEELNRLRLEISNLESYDVLLVGCGGLGVPLVGLVDNIPVRAHTGGGTQLLFRILGGRWEKHPRFMNHINKDWIRPLGHEIPDNKSVMEVYDGGPCYF